MRYQSRINRAQSFLVSQNLYNKDSKENKENTNIININQPKLNRKEALASLHYPTKLEHKISETSTNATITNVVLRKDNYPEHLKRTYTQMVAKDYSQDIMGHLCSKSSTSLGFLEIHAITPNLRSKMVDWMIEVLSSYKMTEQTFFRSVKMMDSFLKKSVEKQELKDLHLIGVASMFTSAKYEEIHPLKLNVIFDKIARKKFKKEEILAKESEVIACLEFKLEEVNVYELARHAVEQMQLSLSQPLTKYFDKIILYLSKMSLFNHELAQQDSALLAAAIFFIGLKTLEQVHEVIEPEKKLSQICKILEVEEQIVIEISRKVLDLAKNFSRLYPSLGNLKKFNKFEYTSQ